MSIETSAKSNPGPLGLLGFGMTTILLNLHNAEIISLSLVIVAMGIAMGGLAQIIAGVLEFKNGNTFGGTAFTAYGFFWWSLVLIWMNPFQAIESGDELSMGFYLLLWGIFTFFMFIGTLKHNRATQVVFGSLTLLFFLLALGDFTGAYVIHLTAGCVGIFCGASAVYSAASQVVGAEFGRLFKAKPEKAGPAPARAAQTSIPLDSARAAQAGIPLDSAGAAQAGIPLDSARVTRMKVTSAQAGVSPAPTEAAPAQAPQKNRLVDLPPSQELVKADVFAEDALPEDNAAALSKYAPLVPSPREEIPRVLEVKLNGAIIRVPNGADPAVLAQTLRLIKHL